MNLKLFCFFILFINFASFSNAATAHKTTDDDVISSLSGTITDKADGKPIPGASISIPDLRLGTVSDANGKYTINQLPKGVYLVQVSFIGYGTFNQRVDFSKTT